LSNSGQPSESIKLSRSSGLSGQSSCGSSIPSPSRSFGRHSSARTSAIATYALCGFANFASVAIQIGGIGTLAPGRRADLAKLGLRAMVGGLLACYLTATVAGLLMR
jgi:hypothetical protein